MKLNPKSEGRNPNNTAKRQGLAFQISPFVPLCGISDFGIREPIAKLPRSSLSKARSPSPLPSPSGRGRTKDRVATAPSGSRFSNALLTMLPLPEGEGRGEGERIVRIPEGAIFAIACRNPKNPPFADLFGFRISDFGFRVSVSPPAAVPVPFLQL